MTAVPAVGAGGGWAPTLEALAPLFAEAAFELRFSVHGQAAVRVATAGAAVAPRHAEAPAPAAPWSVAARCGDAAGWLLADRAPSDPERARELLERGTERHTALLLQQRLADHNAMVAELIERLTHRVRTDVSSLQVVAEGALTGAFGDEELDDVGGAVRGVGEEAQRRLSAAREVMAVLEASEQPRAVPLLEILAGELKGAGVGAAVPGIEGERPMALVPGGGWAACARRLATALAHDGRLGGPAAAIAVAANADGWTVTAGAPGAAGAAVPWTARDLGELVSLGELAVAAGGRASASAVDGQRLRIALTLPAAPSG